MHRLAGDVRIALNAVVKGVPTDGPTAGAAVSELLRIAFTDDGSIDPAVRSAIAGRLLVPILARLLSQELVAVLTDPARFSGFGLPRRADATNLVKWLAAAVDIPSPANEDQVISGTLACVHASHVGNLSFRAHARAGTRLSLSCTIGCCRM